MAGTDVAVVGGARIAELAAGRAYCLSNGHVVDGRASWYAPDRRGVAPVNAYLLKEGRRALLVDTGLTVHRHSLLAQVRHVVGSRCELEVLQTRVGEFNGTCNTAAVLEEFGARVLYAAVPGASAWIDYAPGKRFSEHPASDTVEDRSLRRHPVIALDEDGHRPVTSWLAALRLLPTFWVYDEVARLLCTSDLFTHVVRPDAHASWLVTAEQAGSSVSAVRRHLLGTRYWWLADADTEPIRAALDAFFAERAIDVIGPGYGCLFVGPTAVSRERATLDRALERQ